MRRYIFFLTIVLIATEAHAQTWESVYTSRLNASSSFLESRLNLKTAEAGYEQYTAPYIPSVSLTTYSDPNSGYVSGISFGNGASAGGTLIPTVTFEKIFAGSDLSFKAPVVFSSTSVVSIGNPSISISRSIFPETEANRLDAEASLVSAQASIQKIQNDLKISLVTDVLNTIYYQKLLATSQKNLGVLKKIREATVDTTKFNELDKNILNAQKSILEATDYLADIRDDVINNAGALYENLSRLKDGWLASIKGDQPATSKSIRSIELFLAAAKRRGKLSIVSYLPNPTLTASIYYDTDKNRLGWGLAFEMSYNMFNKGQNSLNALKREEYPKIYKIKLEDAQKDLSDNLRKIGENLRSLELEKKIKNIEISDAEDKAVKLESLYKGGFASSEDAMTAQIDLETLRLDSQKIDSDILVQRLKLARYYDEAQ